MQVTVGAIVNLDLRGISDHQRGDSVKIGIGIHLALIGSLAGGQQKKGGCSSLRDGSLDRDGVHRAPAGELDLLRMGGESRYCDRKESCCRGSEDDFPCSSSHNPSGQILIRSNLLSILGTYYNCFNFLLQKYWLFFRCG